MPISDPILTLTSGAYTFAPVPAAIVKRIVLAADDGGGVRETWTIEGRVRAETPGDLSEARGALEEALAAPDLTLLHGETVVRRLDPADCRVAPRCVELRFDHGDAARLHVELRYTARVEAVLAATGAGPVLSLEVRTSRESKNGEPERVTTEGTATLVAGTTQAEAAALLIPEPAEGTRRTESRIAFNADGTAEFRFTDQVLLESLPSGVTDGHYTSAVIRGAEGRRLRRTEGHFTGPDASARARALRPSPETLIREEVQEDPFTGRVEFTYEALQGGGGEATRAQSETVTYRERKRLAEHVLLAPGVPPYRQELGPPEVTVTQEGSATGTRFHPQPPEPLYPDAVTERQVSYSPTARPGDRPHPPVTQWKYVMRPLMPVPVTPP